MTTSAEALSPDPAWGLGLGLTVFLIAAGAVWASIHLRERAYDNWSTKVDLSYAGLQDLAEAVFGELRAAINALLPQPGAEFDPTRLVADPTPVGKLAKRAVKALKSRNRVRRQFSNLLIICSIAKWYSIAFAAAVLVSTLLYFLQFENSDLWKTASWATAGMFVPGAMIVLGYAIFEGTLQRSYEQSVSGPEGS